MIKMKPATIKRRAAKRAADTTARRASTVERLAEATAKHERAGDLKRAAHYAEMFVEAHDAATGADA